MNKQIAVHDAEVDLADRISALLDGELDDDEGRRLVGRLGREDDAARIWAEYTLIGDAMRGCATDSRALDARIRAALAAEPTVLAPAPAARTHATPFYWMAAAAAVAAITWSVLSLAPRPGQEAVPVATNAAQPGQAETADEVIPLLAAHQDYAYAVVTDPEMRFTQVSLSGGRQ